MEGLGQTKAEDQTEARGERKTAMIINIVDEVNKTEQEGPGEGAVEGVAKMIKMQINIAKMTQKATNKKSVKMTQISHRHKNQLELVLR